MIVAAQRSSLLLIIKTPIINFKCNNQMKNLNFFESVNGVVNSKVEAMEVLTKASLRLNVAQNECEDVDFNPIVDALHLLHELLHAVDDQPQAVDE